MVNMMRAVQYSTYGGDGPSSLQLVDVPLPKPKKGEVLVKVEAAGINAVDWKIQGGLLKHILPLKFPHIPGTDISGEVVGVGPGVTNFIPGDKIISWINLLKGGSLAEYAVAPITSTVKRPPIISPVEGASVPVTGLTALQSAKNVAGIRLDGSSNLNVLITAASGGVGTLYVQLAKLGGCFVTATCGARNMALVKNLGADEVLDYKTPEGLRYQSPSGRKYDVVVHLAPYQPLEAFKAELAPKGMVIDMTPTLKTIAQDWYNKLTFAKHKFVPFVMTANAADLQEVIDLMEAGKLKVIVDSTYPLEKSADAWACSIRGHATGKVVVTCNN
ncbi:unnamed protein product [Sphagnum jensenii]|uniref:Enoyl reductase (ER) domain-containing protein n=1 Tax=Sphagnum jensenii TaxID=128206 RepID=A0ABP0W904_9BRYO